MAKQMLTKERVLEIAANKGKLFTRDLVREFDVSRQYVNSLISELLAENRLIKIGSTKKAFYVSPDFAEMNKDVFPQRYKTSFKNDNLEEHRVLDQIEQAFPRLRDLPENIASIFTYAFSEMVNNAIEHSKSARISVELAIQNSILSFVVNDFGIGVFRNVRRKRKLKSELEAIQDLMKGKTTTMPKSHSGEGIFFTSKIGDLFVLDSFGDKLIVDNKGNNIIAQKTYKIKTGTKVVFEIATSSARHLNDVFEEYTNQDKSGELGFDKTTIQVKLYNLGGVHISRSQARRILSGLEKFKVVVFDFNKVPLVGQAFADEIFRVFHNKRPNIRLESTNMNDGVKFMVERAKNTNIS